MKSNNVNVSNVKPQTGSVHRALFVVGVVGLIYSLLAFGIYTGLTRNAPGANDFYSRWVGARALFWRGENPYAEKVTREIQLGMYGRLARPDEDQVAFAYPLYAAYLAAPFTAFPYALAQALWMALLVVGVVAGALALAVVNRITWSPLVLASILLGVFLFYPSVRGIFLGQYALLAFAFVAWAALALARGNDTTAGILLALASAKPQPVILLLPVILFWCWMNGRRRVVWSALSTLMLLIVSSFLLVPTWLTDFLNGLRNYAQYAPVGPPLETFFKLLLPPLPAALAFYFASAALVSGMIGLVWKNRSRTWYAFQPTLGFVALVTTLMAGRIGTPDQVLLFIFWFAWFGKWLVQKRRAILFLSVCFLLLVPWIVFLNFLQGNQEAVVVTTILPMFTLFAFFALTLDVSRFTHQPLSDQVT